MGFIVSRLQFGLPKPPSDSVVHRAGKGTVVEVVACSGLLGVD